MLLPFFGLSMSLGPIADWGLALERNQIAIDPATTATSQPGIFAIGDVVTYPGKLKLILTGFAEAAIAARSAYALVHPETPLHFRYSHDLGPAVGLRFVRRARRVDGQSGTMRDGRRHVARARAAAAWGPVRAKAETGQGRADSHGRRRPHRRHA